jgi:hypothetical protein
VSIGLHLWQKFLCVLRVLCGSILPQKGKPMPAPIPFQALNISVGTTLTKLIEIPLAGLDRDISFEIANAAGSATTSNFAIYRKLHDQGDWLPYLGGSDFATATTKCTASTPGPQALPAGESAWVDVDCGAAVAVQLWAAVASGTATLSVYGGGRTE